MNNLLKQSFSMFAAGLLAVSMFTAGALCWGQSQPTAAAVGAPPAIEENIPPAFDQYPLGPDSHQQPNAPAGTTFTFEMKDSKIFPGTTRTITVYVPAAYHPEKPACVYVGLDSLSFQAATVFDNLIAQHAVPVTIGVGISSGTVPSAQGPENPRFDRSFEFDSRSNRLADFVLDEVLPEVQKHTAPNGSPIRLSADRNDRAVGGGSTGAIAAFTLAWERPDAFSRVFSAIGTYVGMRGGESYYVLVRKTEPKPIRIFMEDGVHDEWPGGPEMGDWWMSNQTMERALTFAGYDVRHEWGAGTHNDAHATSLFPEAMRWLWRDWPAPIKVGTSANPVLQSILQPGEDWHVSEEHTKAAHLAADTQGKLQLSADTPFAFGPQSNGLAYRANRQSDGVIASDSAGHREKSISFKGSPIDAFVVRSNGDLYAVTGGTGTSDGELWLVRPNGSKTKLDGGLSAPSGLAFSPDGLWLFVAQGTSRHGISYRVHPDGTLDARAPFYDFYVPAWADESGARDITMDRDGRAYVATSMGIQVFDRNGRVAAILPLPTNGATTSLCFADSDFRTLYALSGGTIFRRKMRSVGAAPWAEPIQLPAGSGG